MRSLTQMPSLGGLYAKVLAGGLPIAGGSSKGADDSKAPSPLHLEGVAIDSERLGRYRDVCGFGAGDALPATYPQVVAFPLILTLMTDPAFPFPALGAIHVGNRIEQRRALSASDSLDFEVSSGDARPHPARTRGHRRDRRSL